MEKLLEKIRKIEALIEGAKKDGERRSAILARERIENRLSKERKQDILEYSLYTPGNWHKKLLLAICGKYGIKPYRYKGQKYTTVMVKIDKVFLNDVLWKEYIEYSELLEKIVDEVTQNVIRKIHAIEDEDIIYGKLT